MKWKLCSSELDRRFVFVDENNMAIAYPATVKSQQAANWANKKIRPMALWQSVASQEEQQRARLIEAAPTLQDLCELALRALHEDDFPALREQLRAVLQHIEKGPA